MLYGIFLLENIVAGPTNWLISACPACVKLPVENYFTFMPN